MKRRSQKKERGAKPALSKYARKQLVEKPVSVIKAVARTPEPVTQVVSPSPAPTDEPVATQVTDDEWEVSGTISGIKPNGYLFMMTDRKPSERVFVHANLLKSFVPPETNDRMQCRVMRNNQGLQATKVLRIEKPIST